MATGFDFGWFGRAVTGLSRAPIGGTAFDGVGDVDVGAVEVVGGEGLVEELAGTSDERASGFVFIVAGALADEDEGGLGVALAEDDVVPAFGQGAGLTGFGGVAEFLEVFPLMTDRLNSLRGFLGEEVAH